MKLHLNLNTHSANFGASKRIFSTTLTEMSNTVQDWKEVSNLLHLYEFDEVNLIRSTIFSRISIIIKVDVWRESGKKNLEF